MADSFAWSVATRCESGAPGEESSARDHMICACSARLGGMSKPVTRASSTYAMASADAAVSAHAAASWPASAASNRTLASSEPSMAPAPFCHSMARSRIRLSSLSSLWSRTPGRSAFVAWWAVTLPSSQPSARLSNAFAVASETAVFASNTRSSSERAPLNCAIERGISDRRGSCG